MVYAHSMTMDAADLHKKIRIDDDEFEDMDQIIGYAKKIVDMYMENTEKLDKLISSRSSNWDIARMALIDRLIIKLALNFSYIVFLFIPLNKSHKQLNLNVDC